MASDQSKLIGRNYGRWTVLEVVGHTTNKARVPIVLCACGCGALRRIPMHNLYSGRSTQCFPCGRKQAGETRRTRKGAVKCR